MRFELTRSELTLASLARICALLSATILLLGTTACDRSSPKQDSETGAAAGKHASQDLPRKWSKRLLETEKGPIAEYRLNNVVLRFPKAIVVSGRKETGAVVLFKWPTMEWARTIADPDMVEVIIYFEQRPPFAARRAYITGPDSDRVRVEDPATPDLMVYEIPKYGHVGAYYLSNDEETVDANGDPLSLLCGARGFAPFRLCTGWLQIAPGVKMRYRYYDKHLSDWKAIYRAIFQYITIEKE